MTRLIQVLGILSLAGILALCRFSWFSGDDLCFKIELARYSVLDKAWLQYLHWDGRSLGLASLLQLFCLKYFSAPVITFIWASAFIANSFLVLKIAAIDKPVPENKISMVSIALLSSMMWLGMWKLIPDILYWPTGGWYVVMCLLGLFWIYFISIEIRAENFSRKKYFSVFIISFICGNNSHNFIVPLLLFGLIELLHSMFFMNNKRAVYFILSALSGLILSAYIVMLAPGNIERLHAVSWTGFNASFLMNCFLVFTKYMYWLLLLICFYPLLLWMNGKNIFASLRFSNLKFSKLNSMSSFVNLMYSQRYLIAALSTVMVFSATSFFAVPRTALFFAVLMIIYALQKNNLIQGKMKTNRFMFGGSAFLFMFLIIIIFEMIKVNALKEKLNNRESLYKLNPGKDVIVDPIIDSEIPFAFIFVDISPDSSYWVNRCVALHSGLKTVRTF